MTEGMERGLRKRIAELSSLLDIQSMLLRRSLLTGDLLRWKLLDAGLAIDHPPDCRHPKTGAEPPGAELVILTREQEEEIEEMIIKVPAVCEMEPGDFERHLEFRHPGVVGEDAHSAAHRMRCEHLHKPTQAQREEAQRADIRGTGIEPSTKEVLFISGQDEWGSTND